MGSISLVLAGDQIYYSPLIVYYPKSWWLKTIADDNSKQYNIYFPNMTRGNIRGTTRFFPFFSVTTFS